MAAKTPEKLLECKLELEDSVFDSSAATDSEGEDFDEEQNDCTHPDVTWEMLEEDDEQVLCNSLGYTYKPLGITPSDGKIEWRCTVRNKAIRCSARVIQQGEEYSAGEYPHCHVPLNGGLEHIRSKMAKRKATIAKLDALDDEILSLEETGMHDSDFESPMKRRKVSGGIKIKEETHSEKKIQIKKERQDNGQAAEFYTDLTWTLLENGTNRGNPQLYNSMGYCYTLSNRQSARADESNKKYWRCAVRNKSMWCNSSVVQQGEEFKCVGPLHCHGPKPRGVDHSKIRALVREEAMLDPSRTSCDIVDAALAKAPENVEIPARPLLIKEAGRWKCKLLGIAPKPNFGQKGRLEKIAKEWSHLDWQVVSGGSNRGADYLINNLGYTYTRRKNHRNGIMTDWRCSVRTKTNTCKATVTQRNNLFAPNEHQHTHPPRGHSREKAILRAQLKKLKEEQLVDSTTPTSKLLDTALQQAGVKPTEIGKRETMIRNVNKKRRDAKEKMLYGGLPGEEHSYTTPQHHMPAPIVQVIEHPGDSGTTILDISGAEVEDSSITYEEAVMEEQGEDDGDDGAAMLMEGGDLGGVELQQGEDGTFYIFHPTAQTKSKETEKLKSRIEALEKELKTYKQKVTNLQNTPNRPMVIRLSKGTVQTVACDHQTELTQLRNFKEAAQVCRNQLVQENKKLKTEVEDLRTKYHALSQQMALKEAEWVEAQEHAQHEQDGTVLSVYDEGGTETTIVLPAKRVTAADGIEQYQQIHVPADLIQDTMADGTQTIEVPQELIEGTTYEIVTTTATLQ